MRKAITPLISSVLLIVFAIGLGILVMSWGKSGYAITAPTECDQASLSVVSFAGEEQVCYRESSIEFTIENNGETDLAGIRISVLGDKGIDPVLLDQSVMVADIIMPSVPYDKEKVGTIKKIKFIPKIEERKEKLCPNNGVEVESINPC